MLCKSDKPSIIIIYLQIGYICMVTFAAVLIYYVLLSAAAPSRQFGCFWTNGQICSATSRLILQDSVAPKFLAQLKARAESIMVSRWRVAQQEQATSGLPCQRAGISLYR